MIAIIQRVSGSSVRRHDDDSSLRSITNGFCILLGVTHTDTKKDAEKIADKISKLRIFDDHQGKLNLDIKSVNGSILLISQFTLLGNAFHGNRPSYINAAPPKLAEELYLLVAKNLEKSDLQVKTGYFREYMDVTINNDGPVTIILDSQKL
jgi:D-tyrosyl-tRNA(Tyr) deacylase